MASENVICKVGKNNIFSKQNITSNVLQIIIKHFGTNFVILNIFWKQKKVIQDS